MTLDLVQADTQITRKPGRNGGTLTPFNSERGRAMAARKWEQRNLAAGRALVSEMLGEDVPLEKATYLAAYVKMARGVFRVAGDADDMRMIQAARLGWSMLGADIGAPSSRGENTIAAGQSSITIAGPVADVLLGRLAEMLAQKREP